MRFLKHFPIAAFAGLEAGLLMAVDQLLRISLLPGFNGFVWLAFQAWALYTLAGSTPWGGLRCWVGYCLGILFSIAVFSAGGLFTGLGFWALPVTLLACNLPLMYMEFSPPITNFLPALFLGSGTFFCMSGYVTTDYVTAGLIELLYCALGLLCGFFGTAFRSWYTARSSPAPAAAAPDAAEEEGPAGGRRQ